MKHIEISYPFSNSLCETKMKFTMDTIVKFLSGSKYSGSELFSALEWFENGWYLDIFLKSKNTLILGIYNALGKYSIYKYSPRWVFTQPTSLFITYRCTVLKILQVNIKGQNVL